MIDEVHLLGDKNRGATLESVITRMKTVRRTVQEREVEGEQAKKLSASFMRMIAVSATLPNISGENGGGKQIATMRATITIIVTIHNTILMTIHNHKTKATLPLRSLQTSGPSCAPLRPPPSASATPTAPSP